MKQHFKAIESNIQRDKTTGTQINALDIRQHFKEHLEVYAEDMFLHSDRATALMKISRAKKMNV